MNIAVTVFVILISTCVINASVLDPVIENVVHLSAAKPPSEVPGIWRKKTIWKPRWVKEWKSAKVMKPVWRKIWSPVQIREWVPIPKPPPGWDTASTPLAPVKTTPQNNLPPWQPKNSTPLWQSTENAPVWQSTENTPLWDPIPYPESQQPPPPSPQPSYPPEAPCDNGGGCGDSAGFNSQQISGIIASNKAVSDHNPDYSETVNHLTRVPPNGNWRQPQTHQVNNHSQQPPHFLIPPRFLPLPNNNVNHRFRNPNQSPHHHHHHHHHHPPPTVTNRPATNVQVSQSPGFKVNPNQNSDVRPWNPLPPKNNNVNGHFITKAPDQPYKFQLPGPVKGPQGNIPEKQEKSPQAGAKPDINNNIHNQVNNDFIQQADLVSEYHYSEFDLPGRGLLGDRKPEYEIELNEDRNFKQQQLGSQFTQVQQQQTPHLSQVQPQQHQVLQQQRPQLTQIQQQRSQLSQMQTQQRPQLQQQLPGQQQQHQQFLQGPQQQNLQVFQEQQQQKLQLPEGQQQQKLKSEHQQRNLQLSQGQQQQNSQYSQGQQQQISQLSQVQQHQKTQLPQAPQERPYILQGQQQQNSQSSQGQEQKKQDFLQQQQQQQHKLEILEVQNQNVPKEGPDVFNRNNQLVIESKPRQVRTDNRPPIITTNKLQLNTNLEQLHVIAKEIFPILRTTTGAPAPSFPTNHRFAPQLPQRDNKLSEETESKTLHSRPQQPPATPRPITMDLINNLSYNFTAVTSPRNTETTTPFTVYPSSSFTTTAEPQTNSPVFVVTPVYSSQS